MKGEVTVYREPSLEFRYGQEMDDPHDGLSLFGPYDTGSPSHPKNISYGLVGTSEGIETFGEWSRRIRSVIYSDQRSDSRLWPLFPGFEAAFECSWPEHPARMTSLDDQKLVTLSRDRDQHKRASAVVDLYLDVIRRMEKRDDPLDVIVCVVPDIVHRNCRPQSRVRDGIGYGARFC
jgi:hypothetical protein